MTRKSFQACQYDRLTKTTRRWQIHAGSNHFCFNGHCITGRDLSGALLTVFLISFTSTLWFIFICPILIEELSRIILIIAILLIFYTLSKTKKSSHERIDLLSVHFFRSMCMDPGIILRSSPIERSIFNEQYHVNEMTSAHLNRLIFDISINNTIVHCKYCKTCQMIRPPRSSHCAICSNCISILDHHCPFLSTCIGMRNYRFFILFLLFLLQTELFFFATTFTKVIVWEYQWSIFIFHCSDFSLVNWSNINSLINFLLFHLNSHTS